MFVVCGPLDENVAVLLRRRRSDDRINYKSKFCADIRKSKNRHQMWVVDVVVNGLLNENVDELGAAKIDFGLIAYLWRLIAQNRNRVCCCCRVVVGAGPETETRRARCCCCCFYYV